MGYDAVSALVGGGCIGASALWGAHLEGRVTSVSGEIVNTARGEPRAALFISGLVASGAVLARTRFSPLGTDILGALPRSRVVGASLLVGAGAAVAGGGATGHGVSGLARMSRRSAAAFGTMVSAAAATASTLRTVSSIAVPLALDSARNSLWRTSAAPLLLAIAAPPLLAAAASAVEKHVPFLAKVCRCAVHVARGALLGAGFMVSGIAHPGRLLGFFDLRSKWDASLGLAFAAAFPIAYYGFHRLNNGATPVMDDTAKLPTADDVDSKLLLGSAAFGAGWGAMGLGCGAALTHIGALPKSQNAQLAVLSMVAGLIGGKAVLNDGSI